MCMYIVPLAEDLYSLSSVLMYTPYTLVYIDIYATHEYTYYTVDLIGSKKFEGMQLLYVLCLNPKNLDLLPCQLLIMFA